jgi:hypothetical protein
VKRREFFIVQIHHDQRRLASNVYVGDVKEAARVVYCQVVQKAPHRAGLGREVVAEHYLSLAMPRRVSL